MRRPHDTTSFAALSDAIHNFRPQGRPEEPKRVEITNKQYLVLLKVLMELAPDDAARRRILKSANEANDAGQGQGAKYVACAMVDGILYGNWP